MASMTTSAATSGKKPPSVLPPAAGRASLSGALRSEWTKIRSVRSTYWTLIALLVVSVGLGGLICAASAAHLRSHPGDKVGFDSTQVSLALLFFLGQLVITVLGAMVITSEYSTGMIRTSLTVQPRRGVVYLAKALVFGGVALVVSFFTAFVAFFLGQAVLGSAGVAANLSQPYVLRAIIGSALMVTMAAMLAYGLGGILRHTAAAITSAIGLLFVVPIIVNFLPDNWRQDVVRWLPTSAGDVLTQTMGSPPQHLFSAWAQFAVTVVWVLAAVVAGGILFRKRDA
jgi:ABC-type transport system involved in multi-copper enzyme maturation permease subunit